MEEQMDKLVNRLHDISFAIMCDVDDYCKENGITYYLSGGSCLGAVRHQGFIPWDHDADLMFPRKDYERFLLGFQKAYASKYKVGSLLTEKNWIRQYSKVWDIRTTLVEKKLNEMERGVSIDIFPIDGLPQNALFRKIYFQKTKVFSYLRYQLVRTEFHKGEKFIWIKKLMACMLGRKGSRFFAILLDKGAKKYNFATSNYVGVSMACHYWDKETIERKYMEKAVYLPFEGRVFPVVNGYDQYLKNLYGNYMVIPEEMVEQEKSQQYKYVERWNINLNE